MGKERGKKMNQVKRFCLNCNKELKGKRKKYCSNSCAMKYLNKERYKTDNKYRSEHLMRTKKKQKLQQIDTKMNNIEVKLSRLKKDTDVFMKQLKSFRVLKESYKKM